MATNTPYVSLIERTLKEKVEGAIKCLDKALEVVGEMPSTTDTEKSITLIFTLTSAAKKVLTSSLKDISSP